MIPDFLVTHSGGFHADELMSSAVLTRLFPAAELKRTRAPEWITPGAGKIIYDVGSDYDAAKFIFDHHQRNAPLRDDGQPYSSFGLIWHHYGRDYLTNLGIPAANLDQTHRAIDTDFVLPVDLLDNGAFALKDAGAMASMVLPGLLETLKPAFDDPDPTATEGDWSCVKLVPVKPLPHPVPLQSIKATPQLTDLPLLRQSRLSVLPLSPAQYAEIVRLGAKTKPPGV